MSSRPIDVAGAFARWHKRVILDLADASPKNLQPGDELASDADVVARTVYLDAVTKALGDLMKAEGDQSAVIFAANVMMDLHGGVVGSMHDQMCPACAEGNLKTPMQAFMSGFSAEARRNAKAEPARAEVLQ